MAVARMEYPNVLLTAPGKRPRVPQWILPAFAIRVATLREIRDLPRLPRLTVVRASGPRSLLLRKELLNLLASRLRETPEPAEILFAFDPKVKRVKPEALLSVISCFHRPSSVEFAWGAEQAASTMSAAVAKIWAEGAGTPDLPPSDPLGRLKSVISATADLRSRSGRLSAQKVAELFGVSRSELATLIGRSRQAVWKTDDAETIQAALLPFERIARLRAVLPDNDFRRWLNMSNEELDERTPLEVIRDGKVAVVADLAADMLSGSPT